MEQALAIESLATFKSEIKASKALTPEQLKVWKALEAQGK